MFVFGFELYYASSIVWIQYDHPDVTEQFDRDTVMYDSVRVDESPLRCTAHCTPPVRHDCCVSFPSHSEDECGTGEPLVY